MTASGRVEPNYTPSTARMTCPLLELDDLARILRRSPHTIKRDVRRKTGAAPVKRTKVGSSALCVTPELEGLIAA
jgi:hypothetical protein